MLVPNREEAKFLEELALDLRSTWNHSADIFWKTLDPELWELTHNPWIVLQSASTDKLTAFFKDEKWCSLLEELRKAREHEKTIVPWFQKNYPNSSLKTIAYFSMEFMLAEALPIYSGGLGNVAGDQLKAASDLGVPVIGIGLLYSQGYFRQIIDKEGNQQEFFPYNDPGQLPIKPKRLANGEWLRIKMELPGWSFWLRTWEVKVGRATLYLLDSNDAANFPAHRGITSELYGGDIELRLKQELVLGIGGWRLVEALGISPEICHINEGHAAFAILERASFFMKREKVSFPVALHAIRPGNLFTTHTAVAAGFDRFPLDLMKKYLGEYAQNCLGISMEEFLSLGQLQKSGNFNMAFLAIRGSGSINGVSRLHSEVSRHLFEELFPRIPAKEIPIHYVTNGVHTPSWDSSLADKLWEEACGKERWFETTEQLESKIRAIPQEKIWELRNQSRKTLIQYTRNRLQRQLEARGVPEQEKECAKNYLSPNALTLGFARRFAPYKRPDLLLYDPERLCKILMNKDRPVQLILAGKAHPADKEGHLLIRMWMNFIVTSPARSHVIFLSDYDMMVTENLVQGVDLWINTPKRPWEASGTSGMKVLVNGGLNLSELDGWWEEAYCPEVGWSIGDRLEHEDDAFWNAEEANTLYDLLEKEVIPSFYNRNEKNIPTAWVEKIQESMARLTPYYSTNRVVREYTEKFYLPSSNEVLLRAKNNAFLAKEINSWIDIVKGRWPLLRLYNFTVELAGNDAFLSVTLYIDELKPDWVQVELYSESKIIPMKREKEVLGEKNCHLFQVKIASSLLASSYTPRALPYFQGVSIPLEVPLILWHH